MNISKFIMAGVLCAWAVSSYAENLKEGVPEVKTKLESFSANTGVVIVRGFEVVGKIDGLYDASIEVESKEFVNVTSGKKEYGITIEVVKEDGRYDKKSTSYIDYDEIDSLISGIDYISKVNNSSTSFSSFQADYSTKGGLRVSTFSMNNEIKVAISSGRINKVKAYFNILFLPDIRELIGQAKNKIDALKS